MLPTLEEHRSAVIVRAFVSWLHAMAVWQFLRETWRSLANTKILRVSLFVYFGFGF